MKPYLSKLVRFTNRNGIVNAAIITHIYNDQTVDLTVFRKREFTFHSQVPFSINDKPLHWSAILGDKNG